MSGLTIELPTGEKATIDGGVWTADDALMADYLNARSHRFIGEGHIPDMDYYMAQDAAKALEAKIVDGLPRPTTPDDPDVVY